MYVVRIQFDGGAVAPATRWTGLTGRSGPTLGEPIRNGRKLHQEEQTQMRIKGLSALFAALVVAALVAPLSAPGITKTSGKNPYGYIDLKSVPKPKITGAEIISGLEEFVDKYPFRHNGLPNNEAAAQFLADEAEGYGFKSKIHEFPGGPGNVRNLRVVESV